MQSITVQRPPVTSQKHLIASPTGDFHPIRLEAQKQPPYTLIQCLGAILANALKRVIVVVVVGEVLLGRASAIAAHGLVAGFEDGVAGTAAAGVEGDVGDAHLFSWVSSGWWRLLPMLVVVAGVVFST
jgi:hypothetical protein